MSFFVLKIGSKHRDTPLFRDKGRVTMLGCAFDAEEMPRMAVASGYL